MLIDAARDGDERDGRPIQVTRGLFLQMLRAAFHSREITLPDVPEGAVVIGVIVMPDGRLDLQLRLDAVTREEVWPEELDETE